jgi:hypothetical protein
LALLSALGISVAACAESVTHPVSPGPDAFANITTPPPERSIVCKVGPPGDYGFTASRSQTGITTDGWSGTLLVSNPFVVAAGQCVEFFVGGPTSDQVWVSEVSLPAGTSIEKIVVQYHGGDCATDAKYCPVEYTGVNQVVVVLNYAAGYTITFYNKGDEPPPPPPGGEGCTPGFWRNHFGDWVGYSPSDDFDAVFGTDAFSPDVNLGSAINLGGGGKNNLARHGTAALLGAAHPNVDYGMTPAQVISAVQAAMNSGNYEPLASELGALNEQGCTIDS